MSTKAPQGLLGVIMGGPKSSACPWCQCRGACILLCLGRQSGVLFASAGMSGVLTVPMAVFATEINFYSILGTCAPTSMQLSSGDPPGVGLFLRCVIGLAQIKH